MKVLLAINSIHKGGAENQTIMLINELLKKKIQFKIFYSEKSNYWNYFFKQKKIEVVKSEYEVKKNFFSKIIKFLSDLFVLIKLVKNFRPNIIHANLPYIEVLVYIFLFVTRKKIPFILTRHLDSGLFKSSKSQKSNYLNSFVSKKILLKAFTIIAISKSVKKFLTTNTKGLDSKKVKIIYYGFTNYFKLQNKKNKRREFKKNKKIIFGTLSRLVEQKSLFTLIKGFYIFSEKYNNNCQLIIGGRGQLKNDLIDFSKKLGVDKKIIFIDDIKNLKNFFSTINTFVLSSDYEGLGLVLLEAMFYKTTVVATNSSAIPEVIKHNYNGLLFEKKNSFDLADKLNDSLKKSITKKFKYNSSNILKKKFSLKNQANKIYKIYLKAFKLCAG